MSAAVRLLVPRPGGTHWLEAREAGLTLTAATRVVGGGRHLTAAEASYVVAALLTPDVDLEDAAAFLTALADAGPSVDEIVGAVRQLRSSATFPDVDLRGPVLDIVGTGGDGSGSVNLSTIAALIAVAAGATVAKIGNRAATSRCGSADVLEALGLDLDLPEGDDLGGRLDAVGFAFLFTPSIHPALARLAPVRRRLGFPTILNLVGPLASPVPVTARLLGTATHAAQDLLAASCAQLGDAATTWVVTGHGGVDELTTSGPARVLAVTGGEVREHVVDPADLGLARSRPEDLAGGDATTNAAITREVLAGRGPQAVRESALLSAAAGLHLTGLAADLREGLVLATRALEGGLGSRLLSRLVHPSSRRNTASRRTAVPAAA